MKISFQVEQFDTSDLQAKNYEMVGKRMCIGNLHHRVIGVGEGFTRLRPGPDGPSATSVPEASVASEASRRSTITKHIELGWAPFFRLSVGLRSGIFVATRCLKFP